MATPQGTNRKVLSAQAGRAISARPGMFIGYMSFRHTGIREMTGDPTERPTFPYTFPYTFATVD